MTAQPLATKELYGCGVPLAGSEPSPKGGGEGYGACPDEGGLSPAGSIARGRGKPLPYGL